MTLCRLTQTPLRRLNLYRTLYKTYSYTLIIFVVPFGLMIFLNGYLVRTLRRALGEREALARRSSASSARLQWDNERRCTLTALLVILTFVLSNLLAILINGIARSVLPPEARDELAVYVVILAIGLPDWPQFARVVRGATLVERQKEYVMAARVIGLPSWLIMMRHVLPNVMRPVLVLATIGLALAIIAEATLSFLGQGIPPTTPSLGTLIRVGNEYLFSGRWWITFFPAIALVVLVFAVNLQGDWMRDALNPKLRCGRGWRTPRAPSAPARPPACARLGMRDDERAS